MKFDKIFFSRISPTNKMELVENLSISELLSISQDAIKRIVKETGRRYGSSRIKELSISKDLRTGNNWNSEFEGVYNCKGKLYVNLYVQFANTDRTTTDTFEKFFDRGDYRGEIKWQDRYGNPRTSYFTYSEVEKARCMRRILMMYLFMRYSRTFEKAAVA